MAMRQSFPTDLAAGSSILDSRLTLAGLVAHDASGVPRTGVVFDSDARIVEPRPTMQYLVRAFRAVTSRTGAGVELLANDGSVTLATTAAPASNSRVDIIYVRPRFLLNADGSSTPLLGVVQGAPAVSPVDPAIPAGAIALARFVIPAGVTSTQAAGVVGADVAPFTCAAGGMLVVRTVADLAGWSPADGAEAYCLADGRKYVRIVGQWSPEMQQGFVTLPAINASTLGATIVMSFPEPFPVAPRTIVLNCTGFRIKPSYNWVTPTGMSLYPANVWNTTNPAGEQLWWRALL